MTVGKQVKEDITEIVNIHFIATHNTEHQGKNLCGKAIFYVCQSLETCTSTVGVGQIAL